MDEINRLIVRSYMAESIERMSQELGRVAGRLDAVGRLDLATGAVSIEAEGVQAAVALLSDRDVAEALARSNGSIIEHGFAVSDNQALPWATIALILRSEGAIPASMRTLLGPEVGVSEPEYVREILSRRFATFPRQEFDDVLLRRRDIRWSKPTELLARDSVTVSSIWAESPSFSEAVTCLTQSQFDIHWWGWSWCFDRNCTQILSDFFTNAGTATGVAALVSALSVVAAAAALPLFVLGAYIWLIGQLLYVYATSGLGGCLQGNWPTPWFGAAVWAVPA